MIQRLLACLLLAFAVGCGNKTEPATGNAIPRPKALHEASPEDINNAAHLPLYPGAKLLRAGKQAGARGTIYDGILETPDGPEKVMGYYIRQGLTGKASAQGGRCIGKTKDGEQAVVDVQKKGESTEITIRASSLGLP